MDELTAAWLERIKSTMAIDLARGMAQGIPPKGLVKMLLDIPELGQGLEWRANRKIIPPAVILSDAADYLDDGYHEKLVADLREIVEGGELEPKLD